MSEASLYFAHAAYRSQITDDLDIIFWFTIFIVRFIPFMYYGPARHTCGQHTQLLYHMLLLTFLRWLDSVLYEFLVNFHSEMTKCTPRLLQKKLAIDGLLL